MDAKLYEELKRVQEISNNTYQRGYEDGYCEGYDEGYKKAKEELEAELKIKKVGKNKK